MSTTLNMITIYLLRLDKEQIRRVQEATKTTKEWGIEPTHGLFGSPEWWDHIHFDYRDGCRPESYLANLQRAVDAWIDARKPSGTGPARLDAEIEGDAITITDTRAVASKTESRLNGLSARLLLACDSARTEKGLFHELCGEVNEGEMRHELEVLQENRLVLEQHGLFLSLPVLRHRVDGAHVQ